MQEATEPPKGQTSAGGDAKGKKGGGGGGRTSKAGTVFHTLCSIRRIQAA